MLIKCVTIKIEEESLIKDTKQKKKTEKNSTHRIICDQQTDLYNTYTHKVGFIISWI